MLEGLIDFLREKAATAACSKKVEYHITRIQLLGDLEYRIDKRGQIESSQRKTPFRNYAAFVLRCLGEEVGQSVEHIFSMDGWANLGVAVKVRDRLTHPKVDGSMLVSDGELKLVEESFIWFWNSMIDIFGGPGWARHMQPEEDFDP